MLPSNPLLAWALLLVAVLLVAVGQVYFKLYVVRRVRLHAVFAMGAFVSAQLGFYLALTRLEVGSVYMTSSLSQLAIPLLAHRVLRERIGRDHLIALVFIVLGLALYGLAGHLPM